MVSDVQPPGFVLLADFGPDGLVRARQDTSERIEEVFEGRRRNDLPYVGVAADDPIVAAVRSERGASLPRGLRDTREPWRHVLALRSRTHLEILLGRIVADEPATAMFSRVREAAAKFVDFRGRERPIGQIIDVRLRDASTHHGTRSWRDTSAWLVERALVAGRALVVGRPGSGKSMLLRKLLHDLNAGELRWVGPAIRFDARRLRDTSDPWQAVARQIPRTTREEVAYIDTPALRGAVWLLVDGLDELAAPARDDLLVWLREWPGPLVASSRYLQRLPSDFALFEVEDLESGEVEALLRQEGREDLIAPPSNGWRPAHHVETAPWPLLLRDLCTTPLGVGLLALPSTRPSEPRTELLRRAILHLLDVAEQAGRISDRVRRWCERKGVPLLGALAWRMLQRGHASLAGDDIGALEGVGGLGFEEADLLHQLLEAGGFVQCVGPSTWEFTHKSFAEYCAAVHLEAAPAPGVPLALLARITDPGIQEVVLHLAALRSDASDILEQLLAHPTCPLTAASLATRVLLELRPGAVNAALATLVLSRRLRLATRFASSMLPGRVHVSDDIEAAIIRHATALAPARAALYAACREDVRAWLGGRDADGEPPLYGTDQGKWAEFLYRHLEPELTPARIVRLHDGVELLASRERGVWADDLRPLLAGTGETARRARTAWLHGAPMPLLLERIADLDHDRAGDDEILAAVLRHGSLDQRREALLRHQLSALAFSYRPMGDSPVQVSIHGRLRGLTSTHWLALWDWAWAVGLLGSAYAPSQAVQRLYASFVRDPSGPARWRALVARSQLEPSSAETLRLWHAALDDPFRPVRVEAWRCLVNANAEVPPEHLRRALASLDDAERLLAWEWLTRTGLHVPTELWLAILGAPPASARAPDGPPAPALPKHDAAVAAHTQHARQTLLRRAAEGLTTEAAIDPCLVALDSSQEAAARQLLEHVADTHVFPVAVRTLASGTANRRRWAARTMTRSSWRREQEVDAVMTRAATDDPDPEVVQIAREHLERRRLYEARVHAPPTHPRVRAAAPDLEDVAMAMDDHVDDSELVETITIAELEQFPRFEDLWAALERKTLRWQSFRDMEGFASEEGPEYIGELAGQARSENLELQRAALVTLRRLYRPEAHRRWLIASLDEPLRGYWAMHLLAEEPRTPDLLSACAQGELACGRVARVAIGSDLADEVATAMSKALCAGVFAPPKAPAKPYLRAQPPRWTALLLALGGLESLLKLLHAEAPAWVGTTVLSFVEEHRAYALKSATEAERARTAAWARQIDEADVPRWTLALHLLGVVGDAEDARHWCARLVEDEVSESIAVAALELIGRRGDATSLPTLRTIAETTESDALLVAALEAGAALAGPAEADWMFALLEHPPPGTYVLQAQADAWDRAYALDGQRREAAWAAGVPYSWENRERPDFPRPMSWELDRWRWPCYRTIVRFGDRRQAEAIARMLVDDRQAVKLLQRYGRLPEHALLVFGALRHAPQDHVIPWQITGGGDEVVTDDTVAQVGGTVVDFAARVGAEDVRVAFLRAAFWNRRDQDEATNLLADLGGPQPRDVPELLQQLGQDPADPLALELLALAGAGAGEAGVVACWRRHASPWWSDADTPPVVRLPLATGLRELLLAQFIDAPDELRPFVRQEFGDEVASALPGPRENLARICDELIEFLERRKSFDKLAGVLLARAPSYAAEFRLLELPTADTPS